VPNAKTTPGPWHARDHPHWENQLVVCAPTEHGYIAYVAPLFHRPNYARDEEAEANARLIAASPSLYEFVRARANAGDHEAKNLLGSLQLSD
jgi:hypothetical protein